MNKLSLIAGSVAVTSLAVLLPVAAFADTNAGVNATVNLSAADIRTTASVKADAKGSGSVDTAKSHADKEIDRRITNLNALSVRLGNMKHISASEKTFLQGNISTEISTLTSLKAQIDAETVLATLKTDVESITKDYRVYMIFIPQGRIAAAADRVSTIVADMQALAPKLQVRISAAQNAGKDVTGAQSAYADMQAKVADANTQASAAVSETANLAPDQGNATVEASNKAAIKDAAAKIKTATADLKAARADVATIVKAVKGVGVAATASTTVQAQ